MSTYMTVVIDVVTPIEGVASKIAELLNVTPISGRDIRGDLDGSISFAGLDPMAWLDVADYVDEPGLPNLSTYKFRVLTKSDETAQAIYRAITEGTVWRVALISDAPPRYLKSREALSASA